MTKDSTKKVDIKVAKRNRLILRILFCLVDFVVPIVLIGIKFKLFTEFNGIKLTIMGVMVLLLVLFCYGIIASLVPIPCKTFSLD